MENVIDPVRSIVNIDWQITTHKSKIEIWLNKGGRLIVEYLEIVKLIPSLKFA